VTKIIKQQREELIRNKVDFVKGETQLKEVAHEYNKKMVERERLLDTLRKKADRENKIKNVRRTRKQKVFEQQKVASEILKIDHEAAEAKQDRAELAESRKLMIQRLKHDLVKMKAGLLPISEIEKRYHFIHDDQEFNEMMLEAKRDVQLGKSK
jgi:hypothetical protein